MDGERWSLDFSDFGTIKMFIKIMSYISTSKETFGDS